MLETAHLIVLAPLAAAILILAFGRRLPLNGAFIGIAAAGYGLVHSLGILASIYGSPEVLPAAGLTGRYFELSGAWFQTGSFTFGLGSLLDGLSAVMLVVVTLVSFLVQIFSVGYQHGKPRLPRYFAYLSLFTFSMLVLVVANNLLQLFIGWELVGVCSYLLIGFEFEREEAAQAGRKAFITTKVGDVGFYIGLLLLFSAAGTFNIPALSALMAGPSALPAGLSGMIALLLFCGAVGKSAQFPLHVWLPDAMEGPTPVSALIHAATMVAAGVFLVARVFFLFEASPLALSVVAWVGCFTAFFAATQALVASDIKRVLAYSTISQLGYMVLGLGAGSASAGMFHLTTHACFKALLFLGAGSVIHAVHTNDIWKMGGLRKKMPVTFACFGLATLAIAGLPPLAGFFSKDAVLEAALSKSSALFGLGLLTAGMTAFYMTRVTVVAFLGAPRDAHRVDHAHESGPTMTIPLMILAVPSVLAGWLLKNVFPFEHWVPAAHAAGEAAAHAGGHHSPFVPALSIAAFAFGTGLAGAVYLKAWIDPARLKSRFEGLHRLLSNRYYMDDFYAGLIRRFVSAPARVLAEFDYRVIDQALVDGTAAIAVAVSNAKNWFDQVVVDRLLVDGTGRLVGSAGQRLRAFQNGFAQFYLLVVLSGVAGLLIWALRTLDAATP